ncbi:hypothetical protein QCD83_25050 [Pseudomonas savastanoi pv. phaseolicola]|uniref:hypothetical protein n=1 Tax=Pseudomonas syringae group TaxID=136849 RepID=UPI000F00568D|nr:MULTISPECIES: hypothetical protein [Pseudomonas syringae group]MDG6382097.1 hypothetical protein [Pseudomonas savastanoi pv. phaseolicola]RMR08793.1 hypothetical protein ALP93_03007 [Pseudomonas syringae pv. helianthi]RMT14414.1 hypothetical protein ALP53_04484 [Pseudomonas savastanoi pv. phaseolicola]RMV61789.1 hypothetical protein ALP07_00067 [Pseudomonas savastanoi pv. glycinea]
MEVVKLLAEYGILAVLLMIAGWLFVFKNSRALARQSEINALASAMEKTLHEISDENYKFWKDISEDREEHLAKSKLFASYIDYRCNIVEKKITILFDKSDCWNPAVKKSNFVNDSVNLIARIRDRSTINSEKLEQLRDRYSRISIINNLTLKLSGNISSFVIMRFQPMSEWKWPDNY